MKKKTAWIALALIVMTLLSGCVEKNPERDAAQVVATVAGESVLKAEYLEALNATLASYGITVDQLNSDEYKDIAPTFRSQVLDMVVNRKVELIKAKELGLDKLTADEEAEIVAQLTQVQADWLDTFVSQVASETVAGTMTEEQIQQEAQTRLDAMREANGYTDTYMKEVLMEQLVSDKVYESLTANIQATDEQVQAMYDAAVTDSKARYDQDAAAFDTDMMYGSIIYYYPKEARRVKHILVGFSDEEKQEISSARASSADTANALREEKAAALQSRVDEVMAAIGDGTDGEVFDKVMQEKSDDPGKTTNPTGYIVTADTQRYLEEFRDGSMVIDAVGGIATATTDVGIHILRLEEVIPAGAVDLDYIRSQVAAVATSDLKTAAYNDTITQWRSDMDIKVYEDRLA